MQGLLPSWWTRARWTGSWGGLHAQPAPVAAEPPTAPSHQSRSRDGTPRTLRPEPMTGTRRPLDAGGRGEAMVGLEHGACGPSWRGLVLHWRCGAAVLQPAQLSRPRAALVSRGPRPKTRTVTSAAAGRLHSACAADSDARGQAAWPEWFIDN